MLGLLMLAVDLWLTFRVPLAFLAGALTCLALCKVLA